MLDTGAKINLVCAALANHIGLTISVSESTQHAYQADGVSPLDVVGETYVDLNRADHILALNVLTVSDVDVDILVGTPFMSQIDIIIHPTRWLICIGDHDRCMYGDSSPKTGGVSSIGRTQVDLRSPVTTTTPWPGKFLETLSDIPSTMMCSGRQ